MQCFWSSGRTVHRSSTIWRGGEQNSYKEIEQVVCLSSFWRVSWVIFQIPLIIWIIGAAVMCEGLPKPHDGWRLHKTQMRDEAVARLSPSLKNSNEDDKGLCRHNSTSYMRAFIFSENLSLEEQLLYFWPILHESEVQPADIGWPTGNGKRLSYSQAQLGQATCLAFA